MNLIRHLRDRRHARAVKAEFWARVSARNGVPHRVPVHPSARAWRVAAWIAVVAAVVAVSLVGWSLALGLVLAGATWSCK